MMLFGIFPVVDCCRIDVISETSYWSDIPSLIATLLIPG